MKSGALPMSDTELMQLLAQCNTDTPTLFVIDENTAELPAFNPSDVQILSNRFDIHEAAQQRHLISTFSDFKFDKARYGDIRQVCYRVSKEKRVVEHVCQSAWNLLPIDGVLLIAGYKNDGIKTFAKRISESFNCESQLERGHAHLHFYRFKKATNQFTPLSLDDYHAMREIGTWQNCSIYSKPGVFAWDRFDEGSQLLLQQLPDFLAQSDITRQSGLDLGCGNGLLAIALLQSGCGQVVATDNNAAAIRACEYNIQLNSFGNRAQVIAGNCGDTLKQKFELIVCNPPFHKGFDVEHDLTTRFLQATHQLLKQRGRALFVVNSFIPLERKAKPIFSRIETLADNQQFKLISLWS